MANREPKRIPITLDKPRTLLFDFNALVNFEEATGVSPLKAGIDPQSPKQLRALIWSALLHEDPTLTLDEVGAMVHLGNMESFATQIQQALEEAIPPSVETPGGNGVAAKSR